MSAHFLNRPLKSGLGPWSTGRGSAASSNERAIIASRLVLSIGGLIATYIDPLQASQSLILHSLLIAYVLYSLGLLASFYWKARHRHFNIFAHAAEMILICLIIVYSDGPSSPFFVYFTFVLLVAALRWQWHGALFTGGVLCGLLLALTASAILMHVESADIDRLILRNVYLIVVTGLFAFLGEQMRRSNQKLERLQVAEELHDGVLQTLTAVGFKLHTAASRSIEPANEALLEVADLIKREQRQLRQFVNASRGLKSEVEPSADLSCKNLRAQAEHLQRLWGCQIELNVRIELASLSTPVSHAIRALIAEGVANATLHGRATRIRIEVAARARELMLRIKDNGSGLPGHEGIFEGSHLKQHGIGPRSLRRRAEGLGGTLRLVTSRTGLELTIKLPLEEAYVRLVS
jgi:signal transduction histidine kinase